MIPQQKEKTRWFDPATILISLFFGFLIWVYVDARRLDTKTVIVPIHVSLPAGWELSSKSEIASSFRAVLQGTRLQIESLPDLRVDIDIKQPKQDLDTAQESREIKPTDISNIPPGVVVVDQDLKRVEVAMARLVPEYVAVVPRTIGNPAKGYRVQRIEAEPTAVKKLLPKGTLKPDDRFETYPLDITERNQSVYQQVAVRPAVFNGREVASDTDVYVSVIITPEPVVKTFEKTQVRVLQGGQFAPVKVNPASVAVTLEGVAAAIDALGDRGPLIYIDLAEASASPKDKFNLPCHVMPVKDVTVKKIEPAELEIEFNLKAMPPPPKAEEAAK